MRKVFILSTITVLLFGAASIYYASYNYIVSQSGGFIADERKYALETTAVKELTVISSALEPETEPLKFIIKSEYGLLVIYREDGSFFDNTDIKLSALSKEMQIRVLNGLVINTEQRLYEFLENHTS